MPAPAFVGRFSSGQELFCPERGVTPGRGGSGGKIRLQTGQSESLRQMTRRIEASVHYMCQHLDQPLRVSVLCSLAGVSRSHFFAQFKTVTGLTPAGFFIRIRMRCAAELLATTSDRIKEVASRLGFEDPLHFSRRFKSVHGVAPRHFREQAGRVKTISIQSRTTHNNKTNNNEETPCWKCPANPSAAKRVRRHGIGHQKP